MRALFLSMPAIGGLAIGVALSMGGCGDGDDVCTSASALNSDSGGESGIDASAKDALAGDASNGEASEAGFAADTAQVRFANWSPDAPAVDFCLAPHGTAAFQGPMLARLAAQIDGAGLVDAGAAVLQFPDVSAYIPVEPQQYDARVVVAGATDCSVAVGADATNLAPLALGSASTIALMGELNPTGGAATIQLTAFLDVESTGDVDVRFINAAVGARPLSFGQGSVATFAPIFSGVAFGQAGTITDEMQDAEVPTTMSYVELNPLVGATLSIPNANLTSSLLVATGVYVASGSVVTFALVGPIDGTAADAGLAADEILMCIDNAGTVGLLANCQVVAQ